MTGLAAADELQRFGRRVCLLEAASEPGGLTRSIEVADETIEAFYHHAFPQDRELLSLIDRLGLSDRLEWRTASTAVLAGGRVYPFNTIADLLRFPPLSLWGRFRLGLGGVVAIVAGRNGLERTPVGKAGPRWFGRAGYAALWQPLLEGKFGPLAPRVAMAWLAARMRQRAQARRRGGSDRLGYLRGGFGTLARCYADEIARRGVAVHYDHRVTEVSRDPEGTWHVTCGDREFLAGTVVAAISGPALAQLVRLPAPYARMLEGIPYRGVVCVLLELDRPLGTHYWVNLAQKSELACLAVIEHTNFIPPERYGGRHLVYLTHYVEEEGVVWQSDVDRIVQSIEDSLKAINPGFEKSWITAAHLSRDRWAQPVPLAGGPMPDLPLETGLPGLLNASLAHVFPDDRGLSLAIKLGTRVGKRAEEWLSGPRSTS